MKRATSPSITTHLLENIPLGDIIEAFDLEEGFEFGACLAAYWQLCREQKAKHTDTIGSNPILDTKFEAYWVWPNTVFRLAVVDDHFAALAREICATELRTAVDPPDESRRLLIAELLTTQRKGTDISARDFGLLFSLLMGSRLGWTLTDAIDRLKERIKLMTGGPTPHEEVIRKAWKHYPDRLKRAGFSDHEVRYFERLISPWILAEGPN